MQNPPRARGPRLISRCPVELDHASGIASGVSEDLSRSGLYVRTETIYPVGDELDLRLTLPDGSIVALYARVAHQLTPVAARALGRHAGMGLELIGPHTPAHAKLWDHLEALGSEATFEAVTPARAIVVEPSPPLRARIVRCLEAAGFTVTAVGSAMQALDTGATARPDVIVAASAMPAMTGIDLALAMTDHQTLSAVPLVLTGEDSDLARLEAFRAGVCDHIPVPFLDEELVIRVRRVASSPPRVAGLRGSLGDIGLGTLLSLFEFERKTGVLLVVRAGERARVHLGEGKILHVEASGSSGPAKERLMQLLDWSDGRFELSASELTSRDELGMSVTQLLLEHARSRDEQRRTR